MSELILKYGTDLSIVIRLVSFLVVFFFVLPLQISEAGVRNSLRKLRYQLLGIGCIIIIINVLSLYFLFDILIHETVQKEFNVWLQILNALAYLGMAIIGFHIYHQQYTQESKDFHKKVEIMETKRKKKEGDKNSG